MRASRCLIIETRCLWFHEPPGLNYSSIPEVPGLLLYQVQAICHVQAARASSSSGQRAVLVVRQPSLLSRKQHQRLACAISSPSRFAISSPSRSSEYDGPASYYTKSAALEVTLDDTISARPPASKCRSNKTPLRQPLACTPTCWTVDDFTSPRGLANNPNSGRSDDGNLRASRSGRPRSLSCQSEEASSNIKVLWKL